MVQLPRQALGLVAFLAAVLTGMSAVASTPPPGSPERRAVLDALRPSIEARLGPQVEFVIDRIEISKGWAFVQAEPQRRGGGKIDWRRYFAADEWEHMDGMTVTAILRYERGRWNLIDKAIGATDAWYCDLGPATLHPFC